MLQSASRLHDLKLHAKDGEIGHVKDIYIDDEAWVVRYFVVSTGSWLSGREVLLSPSVMREIDWAASEIQVALTIEQIRGSPDIDSDRPVSRQYEADLAAYYGWASYWEIGPGVWGPLATPPPMTPLLPPPPVSLEGDPHLRSAEELKGYHIEARGGSIGHVTDLILRDSSWKVMFLVVDAGNWLHRQNVLAPPEWIESVSWGDRAVKVKLSRDEVAESPEFTGEFPADEAYAERFLAHYATGPRKP